jgi:biopolymer transport protein ExbD
MRRTSIYSQQRRDLDVKMTPMIDVVFLLLVFFLWTASFRISEQILPSSVSASTGSQPAASDDVPPPEEDFDEVVIRVLWVGDGPQWQVNATAVATLEQVRRTLSSLAAIKSDAPVILYPDPNVPLGHVIDLYDITRLEGFQKVQFAASEPVLAPAQATALP